MKTSRSIVSIITALAASAVLCVSASAHTISIGSFNAGSPGSVSLAMGTYDHGASIAQGSITLTSGPGGPLSLLQSFTTYTNTKPTGLIDGVNNFYGDVGTSYGTLPSDSYHSAINNFGLGAVEDWQVATFTGLAAGTYTYQLAGMTSANWTNINSFANNWSGTLVIPGESVSGVPDGGLTALLLAPAFLGLAAFRRRK